MASSAAWALRGGSRGCGAPELLNSLSWAPHPLCSVPCSVPCSQGGLPQPWGDTGGLPTTVCPTALKSSPHRGQRALPPRGLGKVFATRLGLTARLTKPGLCGFPPPPGCPDEPGAFSRVTCSQGVRALAALAGGGGGSRGLGNVRHSPRVLAVRLFTRPACEDIYSRCLGSPSSRIKTRPL